MAKPTNTDLLVKLHNVGLQRQEKWLVRNIDLKVHPGEIVTLIGPNGAGKSTAVKLALGILKAGEGKVYRRADLRVGYMPQKLSIDWTMPLTVQRFMSLTQRHRAKDIQDALGQVGIGHLIKSPIQALSGGEFQRALLARAMIRKPDLLVLDEPVQGVDIAGQSALYDLITSIRDNSNCGILLISHDLNVVMAATDTVLCINGHVCCQGSPEAIVNHPEYTALLGPGATTHAVYSHAHTHEHLPDGSVRYADGRIETSSNCQHQDHDHAR